MGDTWLEFTGPHTGEERATQKGNSGNLQGKFLTWLSTYQHTGVRKVPKPGKQSPKRIKDNTAYHLHSIRQSAYSHLVQLENPKIHRVLHKGI